MTIPMNTPVSWLQQAIFYEVYPSSFADANNDGIGDIPGITAHLDYIRDLGCNALWINPCFASPFRDGGYDVTDYTRVAERYGTNDDLVDLFAAAHARGMHVLLDLIPGHTSDEHPWFIASSEETQNLYTDRYIWTDLWITGGDNMPFIAGVYPRNGAAITNFFAFQPALNYGFAHPAKPWEQPALGDTALDTCGAMLDVMRFWLSRGADGFRVDMADSLVKHDDDGKPATIATWQYMFQQIRDEFPDAAFVSEWGHPDQSLDAGFDMDFYLDWRWDGVPNGYNLLLRNTDTPLLHDGDASYFNADSGAGIRAFLDEYLPRLKQAQDRGGYFDLITCNHDTARIAPRLSPHEIRLAYATMLLMPGVPFIYYGDEIGMRYRDLPTKEGGYTRTGSRTPMQWDSSKNDGFSQADADALYLPIDTSDGAPTVAAQINDGDSLWTAVHDTLALRAASPAFRPGAAFDVLFSSDERRSFVFKRTNDDVSAVVAVNPGRDTETIELPDGEGSDTRTVTLSYGAPTLDYTTLTLPPQSFAVLQ
ncbi:alpha-amylase family glycosyl hydrolase [uncultured Bifidobacterium sp.]|uniref:alpha-amylase family glycosyl hydrolase n=1 Tax=uncultured Bifidobacterium sp. TaxID=165187 RepID=UPI00258B2AA3|nr:alpha-amylase family glycosyl hydrolase [uncultured Bifidobacterium sp.]MEE0653577.1 alpha-amylase family glycosyl hydrolase [Bifidobacterium criceti]